MQIRQCLFISEIFDNICSCFADDTKQGLPSLAVLARTCKTFNSIALDHLWSDITDIAPLVQCMPPDLWNRELNEATELLRPVKESDWIRFKKYNRRVKSITMDGDAKCSVDVYRLLGEATSDEPLLPNVKTVVWSMSDYAYLLCLHVVMGPKVTKLALPIGSTGMEFSEDEQFDIIRNLASAYPLLEDVDLTYFHNTPQEVDLVSNVICGWSQLHALEVNSLSPAALVYIASLPHLHHLSFADVDTEPPLDMFPKTRSPSFPALRSLTIVANRLSLCSSLIETMQGCPLERIVIEVYGHQFTTAWKRLFIALRSHCKTLSLTYARFQESYFPLVPDDRPEYTATIDTIQPLLSFHNFVSLSLPFTQTIITDPAAEAMAMAWPRLTVLQLLPLLPARKSRPCLTLQGLIHFVLRCLELQSLTLSLDSVLIPENNSGINNVRTCRGGKKINLFLDTTSSPIDSPQEVAAFLSTLCVAVRVEGMRDSEEQLRYNITSPLEWQLVSSIQEKLYNEDTAQSVP